MTMRYLEQFVVSKPQKIDYFVKVDGYLEKMMLRGTPPIEKKSCLKNALNAIRQTAHLNWGVCSKSFEEKKISHLQTLVQMLQEKGYLEDVSFDETEYKKLASTSGESS